MARPHKIGLDYFPLDVDFFEDEKILAISGEFAVKGEIIALRLLCEIYKNGYFVEWSELLKNKMARLGGLSAGLIDEVVQKLVKYGFFDESIFREFNILTSVGIQKRFFEAVKRRKDVNFSDYLLIEVVNVNINSTSTNVIDDISTQSKVKETKVNKSKENYYSEAREKILSNKRILEQAAMSVKFDSVNQVLPYVDKFVSQKEAIQEKWRNESNVYSNFLYWLPKFLIVEKSDNQKNVKPQNNKNNGNLREPKRR